MAPPLELGVDSLNHASVLLRFGRHRLLFDPWFSGTAFAGGWGLRHLNPDALAQASEATLLWISHWHSDHLYAPTLQALLQRNPQLCVLANESANFSVAARLRALGFRQVVALAERTPLRLDEQLTVVRYPTAGIDNMLHVQTPGWSILNYNDCNLRLSALAALQRQIGPIDLLLTNYNHAGKLFDPGSVGTEKQKLWQTLQRVVECLAPRHVVPFASSHYYRVAGSRDQNASLLSFDELETRSAADSRYAILRIGDALRFASSAAEPQYRRREPALPVEAESVLDYGASIPWQLLLEAANARCQQLRRGFPLAFFAVPTLRIALSDQARTLTLDVARGARELDRGAPQMAAHSRAVHDWLGRRFGDDSFFAGAHFEICTRDTRTIRLWAALTLLEASHLSLRDAVQYLRRRDGLHFLWCRREEILDTLASGRLQAGEMRG